MQFLYLDTDAPHRSRMVDMTASELRDALADDGCLCCHCGEQLDAPGIECPHCGHANDDNES